MDYDAGTTVTWGMLQTFAERWPQQLVYMNLPGWFWPLVVAGVGALVAMAVCMVVRTVRGR